MFVLVLLLACGDLCSPDALFWYDHLLAEGGYGRIERERAAFLIREADGRLTLEPWNGGDFRRAQFRGAIPAGAIAIVHTHPRLEPHPSMRDRQEAARLALPVIVVTPDAVIAARPNAPDLVLRTSARAPRT